MIDHRLQTPHVTDCIVRLLETSFRSSQLERYCYDTFASSMQLCENCVGVDLGCVCIFNDKTNQVTLELRNENTN